MIAPTFDVCVLPIYHARSFGKRAEAHLSVAQIPYRIHLSVRREVVGASTNQPH